MTHQDRKSDKNTEHTKPVQSDNTSSFVSILQSTLAALFGVQSEKNREKDFKKGSAIHYIVFGIVGVIVLLLLMNLLVSSVINSS